MRDGLLDRDAGQVRGLINDDQIMLEVLRNGLHSVSVVDGLGSVRVLGRHHLIQFRNRSLPGVFPRPQRH